MTHEQREEIEEGIYNLIQHAHKVGASDDTIASSLTNYVVRVLSRDRDTE